MRTNNTMMKLDEIKNPEFKNYINLAYMQGENNNFDAVSKIEDDMSNYLDDKCLFIYVYYS